MILTSAGVAFVNKQRGYLFLGFFRQDDMDFDAFSTRAPSIEDEETTTIGGNSAVSV